LAAPYDVGLIGGGLQQMDHVINQSPAVPIQKGFVLPHPVAFAAGENEPVHFGERT
jgi:hypothetical protein